MVCENYQKICFCNILVIYNFIFPSNDSMFLHFYSAWKLPLLDFFGMAAMPFLCNGILLFQCNFPRFLSVLVLKIAICLIPISIDSYFWLGNGPAFCLKIFKYFFKQKLVTLLEGVGRKKVKVTSKNVLKYFLVDFFS